LVIQYAPRYNLSIAFCWLSGPPPDPPAGQEDAVTDKFGTPWSGIGTSGAVALSFANTLDWRLRETAVELFHAYADLLRWAWSAGALDLAQARALRAWGAAHPRAAARALAEAVEVREAIAAILQAVVRGEDVPTAPLARLDAACRAAWAQRTLRSAGGRAAWDWRDAPPTPDRPALAAALDAARILTSDERERVRQCADAQCGWFFLDASRNGSRRWCSMKSCGNRNKARKFYRRSVARKSRGA
jgi:predicted RNA-binding Zn ribbon-like protein